MWLSSAWQAPAQLLAPVYDKRRPHGSQPHPRKHPSSQKSSSFSLCLGFSAACFQSSQGQDDCFTAQLCPRVTAGGCSDSWWSLQNLLPPPCHCTPSHCRNLSSSSPHLHISDEYPRGAGRSKRDRSLRSIQQLSKLKTQQGLLWQLQGRNCYHSFMLCRIQPPQPSRDESRALSGILCSSSSV